MYGVCGPLGALSVPTANEARRGHPNCARRLNLLGCQQTKLCEGESCDVVETPWPPALEKALARTGHLLPSTSLGYSEEIAVSLLFVCGVYEGRRDRELDDYLAMSGILTPWTRFLC